MSINNTSGTKANSNGKKFENIVIPFIESKIIEKKKNLIFAEKKYLKIVLKVVCANQ